MTWQLIRRIAPVGLIAVVLATSPLARAADERTTTSTYNKEIVVERTTTTVKEVETVKRKIKDKYSCAIIVANRAEKVSDKKVSAMQDLLTGYVTEKGFSIIAREDVLNSVKEYSKAGPNKGDDAMTGADLDKIFSNNTSALRLAQNLDADYVLVATITTYGADKERYSNPKMGIDLVGTNYKMRTTYRLLDMTRGGSITAGVATATKSDRVDPRNNAVERENVIDDLIDSAAMDMAAMLGADREDAKIADVKPAADEISFDIRATVANLIIPEVQKSDKGEYVVQPGRYRMEALNVSVEIDGVLVGTSGGQPLKARPGLHKLRLYRKLFNDYNGTAKLSDKMQLDIAMDMNEEGLRQYVGLAQFLQNIRTQQTLTDALAKVWEGYGKMFEQSGIRLDKRVNIEGHLDAGDARGAATREATH